MPDDIVTVVHLIGCECDLCKANAEIERLRNVIDAVADLHEPDHTNEPRCLSCGEWPCLTHLILCNECKEARRG